jgi:uncharacterized protein (DUF433 family)
MSEVETRKIIKEYAKGFPFTKILDNLNKLRAFALNIALEF